MYCGIDVAKNKSNVCIIDKNKNVIDEFEVVHDMAGFLELEKHLTPETIIGMETTGNYCKIIFNHLKQKFNVIYVDNTQMKNFSKLQNRNIKNDKVDAKTIATYLSFNFKTINPIRADELKDLTRLYNKTIKNLTRYKYMFKDQINIIFPELETSFYLKKSKAIPYLLLEYPTPKHIIEASEKELCERLNVYLRKSKPHVTKRILKIKELAKNSVGIKEYPTACFIQTIKIMLFYQEQIMEIEKNMKKSLKQTIYRDLIKNWGYTFIAISIIVGEVGDIRRFPNHKKFVKYVGFDVSEKQSGKSLSINRFITKQGNRILRTLFYMLVLCHLRYKTDISTFYNRLREKGKHPKQCQTACGRKLAIRCYYDMLKCHEVKT